MFAFTWNTWAWRLTQRSGEEEGQIPLPGLDVRAQKLHEPTDEGDLRSDPAQNDGQQHHLAALLLQQGSLHTPEHCNLQGIMRTLDEKKEANLPWQTRLSHKYPDKKRGIWSRGYD